MSSAFSTSRRARALFTFLALALTASLTVATSAEARIGGGSSFGSRGSKTFSMPSATPTAPRVSPFQQSMTPNGGFANRSGFGGASSGGLLGGGFGRGLMGGFLGAGLFGLLFGGGLTGGLGGGMSLIGLVLQLGLLFIVVRFAMNYFANRRSMASGTGAPSFSTIPGGAGPNGFGTGSPYGSAPQAARTPIPTTPITIGPEDYQTFEQRLTDSQLAYSNGDINALRRISTAEMAGNFENELRNNASQGVVNKLANIRLLQGDLSEAWRESDSEYATVAMRFSLVDATIETATGRVVDGDPKTPEEVTEVWTFRRPSGSGAQAWALSGIQQT